MPIVSASGLGWWFRLVVWDSMGAPKNPNPFHFRGSQESQSTIG